MALNRRHTCIITYFCTSVKLDPPNVPYLPSKTGFLFSKKAEVPS